MVKVKFQCGHHHGASKKAIMITTRNLIPDIYLNLQEKRCLGSYAPQLCFSNPFFPKGFCKTFKKSQHAHIREQNEPPPLNNKIDERVWGREKRGQGIMHLQLKLFFYPANKLTISLSLSLS